MTIEEVDERIDMKLDIVMEQMDHKLERLLEAIDALIEHHVRPIVQEELVSVKRDMEVVKSAVKETNRDARELKQHVTHIERVIERKI